MIYILVGILIVFQIKEEKKLIDETLNNLHIYASKADGNKYLSLFDDNAIFYGTDAKERWHIDEFSKYALNRFNSGSGWTYIPIKRNIYINGKTAWFDEELENEKYGIFRGTGVLIKKNNKWYITQYNLLLPIPNDLLIDYSKEIKRFLKNE